MGQPTGLVRAQVPARKGRRGRLGQRQHLEVLGQLLQGPGILGAALATGGHLTRLRRTRVGGYQSGDARTLEQLAERFEVLPLAQAAAASFPRRDLTEDEARRLAHGARLDPAGGAAGGEPTAAYAPDGTLIALVTEESGQARPLVVFA